MASTIKVDNIQNQPGNNLINRCSATTTIGSGAGNTINVDGATITIGRCGGTVSLASGATQSGFGASYSAVVWDTSSIKTATFTAAAGSGYFCNTSGGAFTVNLPAGTAGNVIAISDYSHNFNNNNITVTPNGSEKIGGTAGNATLSTQGQSVTFVYVDSTQGWLNIQDSTSDVQSPAYMTVAYTGAAACGTDGDYKYAIFTGSGSINVTAVGNASGSDRIDYLVVGGGGGGGGYNNWETSGGGAGGYRETQPSCTPAVWASNPLMNTGNGVPVTSTGPITITIGAGGTGSGTSAPGAASVFGPISSAGGGADSANGGSGGGGCGSGNTPPVAPPQGSDGGPGGSSGGGGAGAVGTIKGPSSPPYQAGDGGDGMYSYILSGTPHASTYGQTNPTAPTSRYYAGGGGGGWGTQGTGGKGGGGCGGTTGVNGQANMGGGGGGHGNASPPRNGGSGGSGIVIIKYKFQN